LIVLEWSAWVVRRWWGRGGMEMVGRVEGWKGGRVRVGEGGRRGGRVRVEG